MICKPQKRQKNYPLYLKDLQSVHSALVGLVSWLPTSIWSRVQQLQSLQWYAQLLTLHPMCLLASIIKTPPFCFVFIFNKTGRIIRKSSISGFFFIKIPQH